MKMSKTSKAEGSILCPQRGGRPSQVGETAYLARLYMSLPAIQWSCIREALVLIERQWTERRRAKRLACGIPWGHWFQVWNESPAGHLLTVRKRLDWFDAHQCRARRNVHGWDEKLEQGPEKSDCFSELLRWSVGCHQLLRSQQTHFDQRMPIKQSAFMLISLWARFTNTSNDLSA